LPGDDVLVLIQVVEVDQAYLDVFVVHTERHRTLTPQPGSHFLVGTDQAIGANRKDDRAQLVEHLVGTVGLGSDFWVEADQRFTYPLLDQHFLRLTGNVGGSNAVPAKAVLGAPVGELRLLKDMH